MKRPELLAPAGSLQSMRYAFAYGADAVYAGQPRYSLRVRNNEFTHAIIAQAIEEAHALHKNFFLTVNLFPHNSKLKTALDDLRPVLECQPDALIMADPGLMMMVRETFPNMPIHLSVQANTVNHAAVRFWQKQGIRRVILSRELSLQEIREIRQECPDIELEVFVHGALCIAYSGRCLLSGYFNHRDSNQGSCTNACRWQYRLFEAPTQTFEAQEYLLEERSRPGQLMPIDEDENGTYIMNSRDLRAIEHVAALMEMGVDCLKIEGRTKSHYYVGRTTQLYRRAIDDALAGKDFDLSLLAKLDNLANRGYTDGFFQRHHTQEYQNYLAGSSVHARQQFVGEPLDYQEETGRTLVAVKNHFACGDRLEVIQPAPLPNYDFVVKELYDRFGKPLDCAKGSGYEVWLDCGGKLHPQAFLARYLAAEAPTANDDRP